MDRLEGPHAVEAQQIVFLSRQAFTQELAQELSDAWEADQRSEYLNDCAVVHEALQETGCALPLGWFERNFEGCSWMMTTMALHAIADAVAVTLVKDHIPLKVYAALIAPWCTVAREANLDIAEICVLNV